MPKVFAYVGVARGVVKGFSDVLPESRGVWTWHENTQGLTEEDRGKPYVAETDTPDEVTRLEFLDLFTFQELVAIETAKPNDPEIRVALQYLSAAGDSVDLKNPKVQTLLALLEGKSLVAPGRSTEVRDKQRKQ